MSKRAQSKKGPAKPQAKKAAKIAPRAKASPKKAAVPRVARKATIGNPALSALVGYAKKKDFDQCLPPSLRVTNYTTYSLVWVIAAVDSHVKAVMMKNSGMFTAENNTSGVTQLPLLSPAAIRALWLSQMQYFWIKSKVITNASTQALAFVPPTMKIPIGLAKLAQYFCPFYDFSTGVTYQTVLPPLPYTTISTYPSVDTLSTATTCVNTPSQYYLLNSYVNGTDAEYSSATATTYGGATFAAPSDMYAFLLNMPRDTLTTIENLCPTVEIDTVMMSAPDASMTANLSVSRARIFHSTSSYDSSLATAFCFETGANLNFNLIYNSSTAFAGFSTTINGVNVVPDVSNATNFNCLRLALINNYTFLTMHGSWRDGVWNKLLRKSPYAGVRTLSCMGMTVNLTAVSDLVGQLLAVMPSPTVTNSAPGNTAFALAAAVWGSILKRVAATDFIVDCRQNTASSTPRWMPYAIGQSLESCRLPQTAALVSNLGASVFNGMLVFPYLTTDPGATINALSPTGTWNLHDVNASDVSPNGKSSANNAQTIIVSYQNNTAFAYTSGRKYVPFITKNASYIQALMMSNVRYPYTQGIQLPETTIGNYNYTSVPVKYAVTQGYGISTNNGFFRQWFLNRSGAYPNKCCPLSEAIMALNFGLNLVPANFTTNSVAVAPASIDLIDSWSLYNASVVSIASTAEATNPYAAFAQVANESRAKRRDNKVQNKGDILRVAPEGRSRTVNNNIQALDSASNSVKVSKPDHYNRLLTNIAASGYDLAKLALDPSLQEKAIAGLDLAHRFTDTVSGVAKAITHNTTLTGALMSHAVPLVHVLPHPSLAAAA